MGHRGARDKAPENTLRSFKALLESKVSVVEFDIHESADGVWVVHHDETLDRTTNSTGELSKKTWDELSLVRTKEGDPLPTLNDVLLLFKDTDFELQIEIKSYGDFKKLGSEIQKNISSDKVTVISFNHKWLLEFKELNPQIKTTCLLFGLPVNPVEIVKAAKADGISLSVNWIDLDLVNKCHQSGLKVTAWNANTLEVIHKMKVLGVDYLGTDVPFMEKIIFACIHNAGRSQIAAAFFNEYADPKKAQAISAGTQPASQVHPEVKAVMDEIEISLANAKPKLLTAELAKDAKYLITMGCKENCPYIPELKMLDWPFQDPKGQSLENVRQTRDKIKTQVLSFLAQNLWLK